MNSELNQDTWFDNQSNAVEWVGKNQKTFSKKPIKECTLDELKEKLLFVNQTLDSFNLVYAATHSERMFLKIEKLARFRGHLKTTIIKHQRNGDDPLFLELKQLKQENHKLLNANSILNSLVEKHKKKTKHLNLKISELQGGIENQKQKTINVQESYSRNLNVHNEFKNIIKNELGEARYMYLIKKAAAVVDGVKYERN